MQRRIHFWPVYCLKPGESINRGKGVRRRAPPVEGMEEHEQPSHAGIGRVTWGPKLFYLTLVAGLLFFWWLLIYDHGVVPPAG